MEKKNISIFFNNLRGFELYRFLSKKKQFNIDVYLSKKNLNRSLLTKLKNYVIIKKINKKLIKNIKRKKYFLNITAGWPLKFPIKLIHAAEKGTINLHAGKLPEYRGGSPLNWQIIEGKKKIFISIIKMTKGFDTGPIYIEKSLSLNLSENIRDLHKKVNKAYPYLTEKVINDINKNKKPTKQSSKNVRYMRQRSDIDSEIDWVNMNSREVFNLVRAVNKPYLGAFYKNKKKIYRVFKCKEISLKKKLNPGIILHRNKYKVITCKKNAIKIIKEVKI